MDTNRTALWQPVFKQQQQEAVNCFAGLNTEHARPRPLWQPLFQQQQQPVFQQQQKEAVNCFAGLNTEHARPTPLWQPLFQQQQQPVFQQQQKEAGNCFAGLNTEHARPTPLWQPVFQQQQQEVGNCFAGLNTEHARPTPLWQPVVQQQQEPGNCFAGLNTEHARPTPLWQPVMQQMNAGEPGQIRRSTNFVQSLPIIPGLEHVVVHGCPVGPYKNVHEGYIGPRPLWQPVMQQQVYTQPHVMAQIKYSVGAVGGQMNASEPGQIRHCTDFVQSFPIIPGPEHVVVHGCPVGPYKNVHEGDIGVNPLQGGLSVPPQHKERVKHPMQFSLQARNVPEHLYRMGN